MAASETGQEARDQNALILFEERLSDSAFIERVWSCRSERGGPFLSIAASTFEIAVSRLRDRVFLTLRGPETKATVLDCPAEGEWLAIRFKPGTFMPRFLPGSLLDHSDIVLPDASSHAFWLNGSAWRYPDFQNAEVFVDRIAKAGMLVRDPMIEGVLKRRPPVLSLRTAQRHFRRATGLTYSAFRQIERARHATLLLKEGASPVDAACLAGYFDHAHLIRSLRRFIGQTPTKIIEREKQLSFLYKTDLHS